MKAVNYFSYPQCNWQNLIGRWNAEKLYIQPKHTMNERSKADQTKDGKRKGGGEEEEKLDCMK